MNNIKIFNKTNWQILDTIKAEKLNLRDIAKKINKSPATVHNNLKILKKLGIVEIKKQKNHYILQPSLNNFYYRNFMQLINYQKIKDSKALGELEKIGIIGVYGSFAKGTDDRNSDIDLFVFTDQNEIKVRAIVNRLAKELKREINILILSKIKLEQLKKKDYEFYIRLKLESIIFNGEIFD